MSTSFTTRLRAAAELLESVANNRALLAEAPEEDQRRLLRVAGEVFQPDEGARRLLMKANRRRDKAAKTRREEIALSATGIRKQRRQTAFTTPKIGRASCRERV